ncbi:hypothetical protein LX32DRAFT_350373 [Colletotrichum zoysiae]|uniref:Uncharacterized protein n=1 Tax=Colletotrichum zoysiae TaxID=1216348 RepID=A0AAD9M2I3_9PEZI|nr:hypothetical protein LX32DRAFT_350373 [Colletotrichum zoysiae]
MGNELFVAYVGSLTPHIHFHSHSLSLSFSFRIHSRYTLSFAHAYQSISSPPFQDIRHAACGMLRVCLYTQQSITARCHAMRRHVRTHGDYVASIALGTLVPVACLGPPGHGRLARRNPLSARFLAVDQPPGHLGIPLISRITYYSVVIVHTYICIRSLCRSPLNRTCAPAMLVSSPLSFAAIPSLILSRCFSRRIHHEAFEEEDERSSVFSLKSPSSTHPIRRELAA